MSKDSDQDAMRRRAARLREQINAVTGKAPTEGVRRNAPHVEGLSPREFVHRRMADLDRGTKDEKDG